MDEKITVSELIKQLEKLKEQGYGDSEIFDLENEDYALTGITLITDDPRNMDTTLFESEETIVAIFDMI